jgi:hypothetical protein
MTIYFCSLCRSTIKIDSDIASEHHNDKHGIKTATYHEVKSVLKKEDVNKKKKWVLLESDD